jgi:hypothetical protein
MKNLFLIISVMLVSNSWGQQAISKDEFLKNLELASRQYQTESYSLKFKQSVFLSSDSLKPFYEASGQYKRGKGKEYRTETKGNLTVQNNDIKIVMDSATKLVLLFEPDSLFNPITKENKGFYNSDATFFVTNSKDQSRYKVFYHSPNFEYESMEFWVEKKTGAVSKIVLQLVENNYTGESFEDETVEEPLLIVEYQPQLKSKSNVNDFNINRFIVLEKDHYVLTPELKDFTLDDLRYKETNGK